MTQAGTLSFRDAVQKTSPTRLEGFPPDLWGYSAEQAIEKLLPPKRKSILATLLSAGMLVGTGGTVNANIIPHLYDSPTCLTWSIHQMHRRLSQLVDTSERVAALRRYFSLNITDLAKVLRVERPTIYAWLQGNAAPHPGNLKRLEQIYQLSRDWRTLSAAPAGKYIYAPFEDGRSLLGYLSTEELNETAIRQAFSLLQARLAQAKVTSTRRSVAEVAKLHGFPPVPEHIQKKNVDDATGLY